MQPRPSQSRALRKEGRGGKPRHQVEGRGEGGEVLAQGQSEPHPGGVWNSGPRRNGCPGARCALEAGQRAGAVGTV